MHSHHVFHHIVLFAAVAAAGAAICIATSHSSHPVSSSIPTPATLHPIGPIVTVGR